MSAKSDLHSASGEFFYSFFSVLAFDLTWGKCIVLLYSEGGSYLFLVERIFSALT